MTALTVAIFPAAGSVHLYHAADGGLFAAAGLGVTLHEVASWHEQMAGWDEGRFHLMHTSPDHLLRGGRQHDPVIVRAEGIGELSVYVRSGVRLDEARWAVDAPDSAFALVLRAVVADIGGVAIENDVLVPVGGTRQRADALVAGEADGAALHPPFDRMLELQGFERLGGHAEVAPELLTVGVMARREDAASDVVVRYVQTCDASSAQLVAGGPSKIAEVLEAHGWDSSVARAAAEAMAGPAGLGADPRPTEAGLEAVARLRARFIQGWEPPFPLHTLIVPVGGSQ